MAILIGFLTFVLVLVSLFLILLVLVQLPKKEAGVGMAFGAGMSEMILGAGSGNVLTRVTKISVGIFLVLSLFLSVLLSSQQRKTGMGVEKAIDNAARSTQPSQPVAPVPTTPGLQPLVGSNAAPTAGLTSTTTVVNPTPVVTPPVAPAANPAPAPAPPATGTPAPAKPAGN
jgi:preprotein translocase subunit SecG